LKKAFEVAERVLVFVGSANLPRTLKNPFTFYERSNLIDHILQVTEETYTIYPLNDYILDNKRWKDQITTIVGDETSVVVIGGSKGEWYYDLFPEYDVMLPNTILPINATDIRNSFYESTTFPDLNVVPVSTLNFMADFAIQSSWYGYLVEWYNKVNKLRGEFGKGPFLTCDNVITHRDRVLLVKRKNQPGKGLWAIPGGYFDATDNSLSFGCHRELDEETSINLSYEQFEEFKQGFRIFDSKARSHKTRIVTYSSYVAIPSELDITVSAGDDAGEAKFFLLSDVKNMKSKTYDDHYDQIEYFTNFGEKKSLKPWTDKGI
jgi:bifunctional NMN adenylyltransferase/nudix hydrolase